MNRKKILVSTDLSPKSEAAVNKAIVLAKRYDRWLEVLHVINPPLFEWTWGSEYKEEQEQKEHLRASKERELSEKIKNELKRRSDKLNVHVRVGSPAEEIINFAKLIDASAIILGGSGEYHPLESLFIGTTTKRVIEAAHIPVLVVKNNQIMDYKNILIPTDFSEESKKTVGYTISLFPDATITLLHMMEVPSEFRLRYYGMSDDDIKEVLNTYKIKEHHKMQNFIREINELDVCKNACNITPLTIESSFNALTIISEAQKIGADLISINVHGINDFTSKLVGNIADDVLNQSPVDVLMYQDN